MHCWRKTCCRRFLPCRRSFGAGWLCVRERISATSRRSIPRVKRLSCPRVWKIVWVQRALAEDSLVGMSGRVRQSPGGGYWLSRIEGEDRREGGGCGRDLCGREDRPSCRGWARDCGNDALR